MKLIFLLFYVTFLHAFTLPQTSLPSKENNTTNTLRNDFFTNINNLYEQTIITKLKQNPNLIYHQFLYKQNLVHIAVANKKYQLLKYLSKTDISVYTQDSNGNTPLHIAIYKNDIASIGILMKFKNFTKSLGIKNNRFLTPIEMIKKGKNKQLKKMFLRDKSRFMQSTSKQPPIEATIRISN